VEYGNDDDAGRPLREHICHQPPLGGRVTYRYLPVITRCRSVCGRPMSPVRVAASDIVPDRRRGSLIATLQQHCRAR